MNSIYEKISEIEKKGIKAVLCIVINSRGSTPRNAGSKMLVFEDGSIFGTVGGGEVEANCIKEASDIFNTSENKILKYQLVDPDKGDPGICGGEVEIFLELIGNSSTIVIIGAGHVGKSIGFLARWAGFNVILADDRRELLEDETFSNLRSFHYSSIKDFSSSNIVTQDSFVVLATRNMSIDISLLPFLINNDPKYIGVIGSERRWVSTKKKLEDSGINKQELEKIYSPIGIDLKGETPEEIAISILAEILMIKNKATGKNLRDLRRD